MTRITTHRGVPFASPSLGFLSSPLLHAQPVSVWHKLRWAVIGGVVVALVMGVW